MRLLQRHNFIEILTETLRETLVETLNFIEIFGETLVETGTEIQLY